MSGYLIGVKKFQKVIKAIEVLWFIQINLKLFPKYFACESFKKLSIL